MNARILITIISLSVSSLQACICIPDKDITESYENHDFIAICDVTEIIVSDNFEEPQLKTIETLVRVVEPLKGKRSGQFLLTSTHNDCSYEFNETGRYLLFMKVIGGTIYCSRCSPNERVNESTLETISRLRELKIEHIQSLHTTPAIAPR